jgi:predicted nucleic acid-binding protein
VIVLDTTVLIDVLRGHQPAIAWISLIGGVPRCSELTRTEVLRGLRSVERAPAERLFGALVWVPVLESIAREAGELGRRYRRSHNGIGTVDLVVAATANRLGARLATANVRHYPMFKGLRAPYA